MTTMRVHPFEMNVDTWQQAEATVKLIGTLADFKIITALIGRGSRNGHVNYVTVSYVW